MRQIHTWVLALCLTIGPAWAAELPASGTMEVLFPPWDDAETAIVTSIAGARHNIFVQAYAFTSRTIAQALVEAQRRGVEVEVLADGEMNRRAEGNSIPTLLAAGIPVAYETRYNAAHNKVILVDPDSPRCAVVTGSYNFTWSAQARNAENLLILRGNRPLARLYLENWRRHRAEAVEIHRLPFSP